MKFSDFLAKWQSRYIDFDGAYGPQCMDLMHQYCVEILGLSDGRILAAPSAKDVYNTFDTIYGKEYFDRIPNTPDGVPEEGDIVLWGNGTWGHVAVFVEGNVNSFRSFDQNFPVGSPCHIQNHTSYSGVLGWLRFKTTSIPISPALQACQTQLAEEVKKKNENWNWGNELSNELEGTKSQIQHYQGFEQQLATTLNCEVDEAKILGEITKSISCNDTLTQTLKNNESLESSVAKLMQENSQLTERVNNAILQNQEVSKALSEAVSDVGRLTAELEKTKQQYDPVFEIMGFIICKRKG